MPRKTQHLVKGTLHDNRTRRSLIYDELDAVKANWLKGRIEWLVKNDGFTRKSAEFRAKQQWEATDLAGLSRAVARAIEVDPDNPRDHMTTARMDRMADELGI